MSPTPPASKGSKRRAPPPPPPRPKKQKIVKTPEKKSYEKTSEELDAIVAKQVHDHFHGPKPPPEKKIDMVKFKCFLAGKEKEKLRVPVPPPLSDYDRAAVKINKKNQKVRSTVS